MRRRPRSGKSVSERTPTAATGDRPTDRAVVLVVAGDGPSRTAIAGALERATHDWRCVDRLDDAKAAVSSQRYDLIVVDPALPDGDGHDLPGLVRTLSPSTKTIFLSENPSFVTAQRAMRAGAIDVVGLPADPDDLCERLETAITLSREESAREERIRRLQKMCRDLRTARQEISDQVDVLCADLVSAYQDLTEQIDDVAMVSEFRAILRQELDVEDVLRTALEYLLSKTGPTNAAVFLPDAGKSYSLGAYVNYDCPRESIDALLEHLCQAICPQMSEETEIVSFGDAREFSAWIGTDGGFLAGSQVIALSCRHDDECLAVLVLFRGEDHPFDAGLAGTLDLIRTVFAEQLSRVVRIYHRANPDWPDEPSDDDFDHGDDYGFGYDTGLAA